MAPVRFQPHTCRHCEGFVIELVREGEVSWKPQRCDMTQDKLDLRITFRDLTAASADGCELCRWILYGKAISRKSLQDSSNYAAKDGGEIMDRSTYELLARADDENPECARSSMLEAVRDLISPDIGEYGLVAATNPPIIRVGKSKQDIQCIPYFGLCDPHTRLVLCRTANGLQLFTSEQDTAAAVLSTRPIANQPSEGLKDIAVWLGDCMTNHRRCRSIVTSPRGVAKRVKPRRLLHIEKPRNQPLRLNLQSTDKLDNLPPFAALSYCWGGNQTFRCDESTVTGFMVGIPLSNLPATIRDAVTVCEQLKIQYLWVDSLCILQDDEADKAIEIAKMPSIYGGAVFTIVASRAASAWDGFLGTRVPDPDTIPAFQIPWPCEGNQLGSVTMVDLDVRPEPIDERGWTFQERLLSTRLVEFGSRQTRCTCRESRSSAGYRDGWRRESETDTSYTGERVWAKVEEDIHNGWQWLILRYTQRKLTHGTDRPLAISGIAERCTQLADDDDDEYLAGLWKKSLQAGLLWAVLARDREPRPLSYQGPSWSWLAVGSPTFNLQLNRAEWGPEQSDSEILSVRTELANARAPFGATREGSGRLRIRGRLARATYGRENPPGVDSSSDHEIHITGAHGRVDANLYLDYAEDAVAVDSPGGPDNGVAVAALEIQSRSIGPSWFSFGLVLRPIATITADTPPADPSEGGKVNVFTRIGVFELGTSLDGFRNRSATDDVGWGRRSEEELNCFRDIEPSVIEIV
ncbi:heterokaryon incompatibility protein-domain-containing protein [Nemania sp. NC0429]|nr:heterokaryon incompatibility protein-domain-containing protein [Nemania sp. NC0429]